jgi:hypothetical protein
MPVSTFKWSEGLGHALIAHRDLGLEGCQRFELVAREERPDHQKLPGVPGLSEPDGLVGGHHGEAVCPGGDSLQAHLGASMAVAVGFHDRHELCVGAKAFFEEPDVAANGTQIYGHRVPRGG